MRQRCAIVVLLGALLAGGCGGGDEGGTQSFVGKTSTVALYVNWTRDGDALTGTLTQGVLNERTNAVATKRASLTGKVSGSGVTLDVEQQYGETSRLNGTLNGDVLELEYLSGASGVTTVRMEKADSETFNAALAGLRDTAEQTKADVQTDAAEGAEEQRVTEHVRIVLDDIAALKTTVDTSLPSKGAKYDADIAGLKRDLASVKTHTKEALAADNLSVCSSSSLVQSGVSSLETGVAALQSKQERAATAKVTVNDAITKLIDDYSTLQADDRQYLPDDAPTRATVSRAISSARRKLHKAGTSGTSVLEDAEAMVKEAKALEARATTACQTGGG